MKKLLFFLLILSCSVMVFAQGEKLEVEGAIIIDNNEDPNPVAGTIRWTGTDFEGFNGTDWLSLTCCDANPTTVTDQDGNDIPIAYIGDQCWMAENLRVTTFNDGTPINFAADGPTWSLLSGAASMQPAYSWLLDDQATYEYPYGAVYNWYAISPMFNGGKNICPQGWHVPTNADMVELFQFLDPNGFSNSSQIAGGLLKAIGDLTNTGLWAAPNTGATDDYGFAAIPSIRRNTGGSWFQGSPTTNLKLWTYPGFSPDVGSIMNFNHDDATLTTASFSGGHGFACRCIKD